MAQKRDDKPRTRRAERRARADAATAQGAPGAVGDDAADDDGDEDVEDPDEDVEGDDDGDVEDPDDGDEDAEGDDDDSDEARPRGLAAPAPNRAARRAQKARERGGAEEDRRDAIRDRNRRARQEAAERRRGKRQAPAAPVALSGGLDATERVDDALVRFSFAVTKWVRKNSTLVQTAIVLSFLGLIGWTAFRYFNTRSVGARSDAFFLAIERLGAPVGEPVEVLNPEGSVDARPTYPNDQERLAQAIAAFEKARSSAGNRPLGVLADLGHASALLEAGQYEQARAKYDAVQNTSIAGKDPEVRGRALEGVGLALEAKGDLDGALKAYQQLENLGVDRFTRLALYHRARVHHLKGEDPRAKELLADLDKRLGEPASPLDQSYLRAAAQELRLVVDPSAPPGVAGLGDLGTSGQNLSAMQKSLEELLRQAQVPVSPPGTPAPAPAPSGAP